MCPAGWKNVTATLTSNGNHSNGNGSKFKAIAAESVCFGAAELVSMATSLGIVAVADQVAPNLLKSVSKVVAKTVVEPNLDWIENNLKKVCKLEECQPDMRLPREERAESLAKTLTVFGAAWAGSMGAKLLTRRTLNRAAHIIDPEVQKTGHWILDNVLYKVMTPSEWRIFVADEGVHYGSLIMMNTKAAHTTNAMMQTASKILQNCGMSKQKSDELSAMGIIWELPNVLGLAAGIGAISYNHTKASHVQQLANKGSNYNFEPSPN